MYDLSLIMKINYTKSFKVKLNNIFFSTYFNNRKLYAKLLNRFYQRWNCFEKYRIRHLAVYKIIVNFSIYVELIIVLNIFAYSSKNNLILMIRNISDYNIHFCIKFVNLWLFHNADVVRSSRV